MTLRIPHLTASPRHDRITGVLLCLAVLGVILSAFTGWRGAAWLAEGGTLAAILWLTPTVRAGRQVFVLLGAALAIYAVIAAPHAGEVLAASLAQASFILAFFCALATLRHAAELSDSITRAAVYLAQQPPGRRYTALTLGAQVFALVLNYGSISLLGAMARSSARSEPDPEIARIRTRRMLLAVQRGFAASLVWSPLALAVVISTTVIPGATWGSVVLPSLVSAALMAGIGWTIDRIYKPKLRPGQVPTRADPADSDGPRVLLPVLALLALIALPVSAVHLLTGLPASRIVLAVVPLVAAVWLWRMGPAGRQGRYLAEHSGAFLFSELPALRSEIVLLTMAGFLGTGAGTLLAPLVTAAGFDMSALPVWLVLVLPIWLIPLGGQIGMNPILFVSLFGPLLPTPDALGISPVPMVLAFTGGWAMAGVTSPFTASVMLTARLGDADPLEVSHRWNGPYVLILGVALTAWVLLLA
ncbi:hypothetical protein PSM7751_03194 [Pseudooceanicola marinus]|uniref:Citrate transporter n=1 Tax=Pseudooceanicola marinus TaxID=396013 RepID=A0A1X6ZXI3_9RHOB|nr:hypothetical protein [Pseudooceanicola marinus]PJE30496.1 hypothetical protein CVM50_09550 [Pseudooceanicola marinus]SLN62619.1 hypothetical protein PSM7751_03194 [Pseudooceanicola marinus]